MNRMQLKKFSCTLAGLLITLAAYVTFAQANSDITQKIRTAMDAYGNLEIEAAVGALKEAEALCVQSGISGPQLARVFVNRGVVEMGGNGDSTLAMDYFKKALCHDSSVMLDPLNSTPDMDEVFKGAQAQVSSQGCAGLGPQTASTEPSVDDLLGASTASPSTVNTSPAGSSGEIVNDVLRHKPVTQQTRLVPIPFYVATNDGIPVASVVTFYRTVGERIFQQLPMKQKGAGWSAYIECDVLTTLDPTAIEYYIAVMDNMGQLLSTAGSEAQPFTIRIGESISAAPPAIPGESPLPACAEDCPPWNPDCNNPNCKKYADLCSETEPCCSGMACVDGTCVEAGGGEFGSDFEDGDIVNTKGANTKVRFYVNGGVGLGVIPREKYYNSDFPNMRSENGVTSKNPGIALSKFHLRIGAMFALTEKFELGLNFRGDMPLFSEFYDPIVPSVIANAAIRIAGSNAETGFQMFGVLGFGWVQIMHRVPFKDCLSWDYVQDAEGRDTDRIQCNVDGWDDSDNVAEQVSANGFRKSGYLGAEFGFDMNYWFVRNVGLNLGTIFDVTFPTATTLNLDIQLGLALRF